MTWPWHDWPALCLLPIMLGLSLKSTADYQISPTMCDLVEKRLPQLVLERTRLMKVKCVRWSVTDICCHLSLHCSLFGCLWWILGDSRSFSRVRSPSVLFSLLCLILPSVCSFCTHCWSEVILVSEVILMGSTVLAQSVVLQCNDFSFFPSSLVSLPPSAF